MSDLTDGKSFHLRVVDSPEAAKIDEVMENFEPATADPMERPIKNGSLCAAKFTEDGCWYRARIIGAVPKEKGAPVHGPPMYNV